MKNSIRLNSERQLIRNHSIFHLETKNMMAAELYIHRCVRELASDLTVTRRKDDTKQVDINLHANNAILFNHLRFDSMDAIFDSMNVAISFVCYFLPGCFCLWMIVFNSSFSTFISKTIEWFVIVFFLIRSLFVPLLIYLFVVDVFLTRNSGTIANYQLVDRLSSLQPTLAIDTIVICWLCYRWGFSCFCLFLSCPLKD